MAETSKQLLTHIEYKNYTIIPHIEEYTGSNVFMGYPTGEGVFHDYDWNGDGYTYCGNAIFGGSVQEIKDLIDEK